MRRNGFTLIEISVVVGIACVLAAILLSVFSRARENGRRANCASNLKQLGLALIQYTQDYDEHFPNILSTASGVNQPNGWVFYSSYDENGFNSKFDVSRGSLFAYTKSSQIYVCPSDSVGQKTGNSYTLNHIAWNTCQLPYCFGRRLSNIKNASTNVLAIAGQETLGASTNDGAGIGCNLEDEGKGICHTGTWHFGGENVLHVDGHVKWLSQRQLISD